LLIAHGQVVSALDAAGSTPDAILRWIRAHDMVIQTLRREQSEFDAAEVMARWLSAKRETARWVAVPDRAGDDDIRDRIAYVLGASAARQPVAVS
jgi:hypothetical protein